MKIAIIILTIYFFIKTFSYGMFEIKENKNKSNGTIIIALAVISLIFSNVMILIN